MAIPVVFIHRGDSDYLFNTFYQLKYTNPGIPVYLIGTPELKLYSSMVTHVNIEDYMAEASAFAKIYRHLSSNDHDYELFCIQRWFVLKEFLTKNKIERILYLDSDVLFYSDVQEVADKFNNYGMTVSEIMGHTNFIKTEVLIDFCDFILDCYTCPRSIQLLDKYYADFMSAYKSGISDMTFFFKYLEAFPDKVFNYFIWDGNETLSHNIHNPYGWDKRYVMNGEYLKIVWKSNKPYLISSLNNELILSHTLHFQGDNKVMMTDHIPIKNFSFYQKKLSLKLKRRLLK